MESIIQTFGNKRQTEAEKKPDQGKKRTDLAQNISGQQGIVPYTPPIPQVYNQPHGKFIYGNYKGSSRCFQQQRGLIHLSVQYMQRQQAGSSGEHHGPVGIATEQDFQSAVAQGADCKNKNTHTSIICGAGSNKRGII